eukprot:scaffold312987_cov37-Prasinocladus_malaysianus.AAC.1
MGRANWGRAGTSVEHGVPEEADAAILQACLERLGHGLIRVNLPRHGRLPLRRPGVERPVRDLR